MKCEIMFKTDKLHIERTILLKYLKKLNIDQKIILLDYQNEYICKALNHNEQCYKKF